MNRRPATLAWPLGCAVLAGIVIAAFQSVGTVYYQGFRVPQGYGMEFPIPQELAHFSLYFVFGLASAALLAVALLATSLPAAVAEAVRALGRRPLVAAVTVAALATVACAMVRGEILGDGVLSDDEYVYRFIAQTLRTGSLTAPSPGADLAFFREQFVVVTEQVRYGKYPVGFPLLLAAGQALHAERWVVPLVTGLLVLLIAAVGRQSFSPTVATLALLLFASSPQVLITGASLLSQPASAACLMGAIACLLTLLGDSKQPAGWAFGAGALLAGGIVVRPLPGVLFAAAVVGVFAFARRLGFTHAPRPRQWIALLAPMAIGPAAILWVNFRQSGHPLMSGYHAVHSAEWGASLLFHGTLARWAMSLVTNLVRLNFWLFGWPLSLVFCFFARRTPATRVCWVMIAADVAYRLIAPKGGIGTAGPVYFYEIVPLLCLLSADGIAHVASRWSAREAVPTSGRPLSPLALSSALLALALVSVSLFLPFKLQDVARVGEGERVVFRTLRAHDVHHALVFHRGVVPPWTGLSWAYYPPPNPPGLDGDVLFVVLQPDLGSNLEFWRRRYPDRQAWFFEWEAQDGPRLVPLVTYLRPPAAPSEAPPPPGS